MIETKELPLKTYFEKIESHFCGQRGAPLLLSPLDFERVIVWYEMRWHVDAVCEGISRYFDRLRDKKVQPRRAIVLSFCERHIEDAINERKRAMLDVRDGIKEYNPEGTIREYVSKNISILRDFIHSKPEEPALIRFIEDAIIKMKGVLEMKKITVNNVERVLGQIDRDLGNLCRLLTPKHLISQWERTAKEEIGEAMPNIPSETLFSAVQIRLITLSLNFFKLPRLSLAYLSA